MEIKPLIVGTKYKRILEEMRFIIAGKTCLPGVIFSDNLEACTTLRLELKNFIQLTRKEVMRVHYKNGREAKLGDKVVGKDCSGNAIGGVLVSAFPGSTTCNGHIVATSVIEQNARMVTLSDCLHVDDIGYQQAEAPPA